MYEIVNPAGNIPAGAVSCRYISDFMLEKFGNYGFCAELVSVGRIFYHEE